MMFVYEKLVSTSNKKRYLSSIIQLIKLLQKTDKYFPESEKTKVFRAWIIKVVENTKLCHIPYYFNHF